MNTYKDLSEKEQEEYTEEVLNIFNSLFKISGAIEKISNRYEDLSRYNQSIYSFQGSMEELRRKIRKNPEERALYETDKKLKEALEIFYQTFVEEKMFPEDKRD